jgi:hypothetical protein
MAPEKPKGTEKALGFKAYKDIAGTSGFGSFRLRVDHVPRGPFAAPSELVLARSND